MMTTAAATIVRGLAPVITDPACWLVAAELLDDMARCPAMATPVIAPTSVIHRS
jgi:hypothetical protein